jgi:ketosteroid isomerase-like protein
MNINVVIALVFSVFALGCAHVKTETNLHTKEQAVEEESVKMMSNLEIIKSTFEGDSSEENGKNLRKHLSKSATWKEADGFPLAGVYIGFEEISEKVFKRLSTEWTDYRFVVDGYVDAENRVFAYDTYYGTYNETGRKFSARVAHLWMLENNKIVSFEQFVDSVPVVESME